MADGPEGQHRRQRMQSFLAPFAVVVAREPKHGWRGGVRGRRDARGDAPPGTVDLGRSQPGQATGDNGSQAPGIDGYG